MKAPHTLLLFLALSGCHQADVESGAQTRPLNLNVELAATKASLSGLLPDDMRVGRAEVAELPEGRGILLHAVPKDADKTHPSFALFLWPNGNPKIMAYETGEGAHTFRRIGTSEGFRVYYSDPTGFLKEEVQEAFCTKDKM